MVVAEPVADFVIDDHGAVVCHADTEFAIAFAGVHKAIVVDVDGWFDATAELARATCERANNRWFGENHVELTAGFYVFELHISTNPATGISKSFGDDLFEFFQCTDSASSSRDIICDGSNLFGCIGTGTGRNLTNDWFWYGIGNLLQFNLTASNASAKN